MNKPLRLAINGYGRIGRCFLRAPYESPLKYKFRVVCINEPAQLESIAYLSRFDSTHGVFPGKVEVGTNCLEIDGETIQVTHAHTPEEVDWNALEVDLLIECSGCYTVRPDFASRAIPCIRLPSPFDLAAGT